MNAEHTPGPWVHQSWPNNLTYGDASDSRCYVATVGVFGDSGHDAVAIGYGSDLEEAAANARLIAAAPDLLHMVRKLREAMLTLTDPDHSFYVRGSEDLPLRELVDEAKAVIAKATGKAPA